MLSTNCLKAWLYMYFKGTTKLGKKGDVLITGNHAQALKAEGTMVYDCRPDSFMTFYVYM